MPVQKISVAEADIYIVEHCKPDMFGPFEYYLAHLNSTPDVLQGRDTSKRSNRQFYDSTTTFRNQLWQYHQPPENHKELNNKSSSRPL